MRVQRFLLGAALAAISAAAPAAQTISYSYDVHGRLVKVTRAGGPGDGLTTAYWFDGADNRLRKWIGAGTPPPSFSVSDARGAEGGALLFTVTKTGSTSLSLNVSYGTAGGTATAGTDFTSTSGMLAFAASETSKTVSVATLRDSALELEETLTLTLSSPTNGAWIGDSQGVGTIERDPEPVNRPPATANDSITVERCSAGALVNVTANDTDLEGNTPLTLSGVTAGEYGDATVGSSTSVRYTPYNVGTGTDVLTYTVKDSLGAASTGSLTVSVVHGSCGPMF